MVKPKAKEHIIEEPVVQKLFTACEDLLDRVVLILLRHAGMREGEVAHCRGTWWDGKIIRVPKVQVCNCADCKKALEHPGTWQPKTAEAVRMIPIEPAFRKPISMFFNSNQGVNLSRSAIWRRIKRMAKRAGITSNVFPHAMRATYITRLLERKVPDWVVRQLVGHANVATTSQYAKLSERIITDELSKAWG